MTSRATTIVVVARERFSGGIDTLRSVYDNTRSKFELFYIDANSPPPVREQLRQEAKDKGFQLVCTNQYLSPNQARNIGVSKASGEYIVFLDNDVTVSPEWLEKLTSCADETGATIVCPLYMEGEPHDEIVHMAGGTAHLRRSGNVNYCEISHRFAKRRLKDVRAEIRREATELMEFHCVLIRRSFFEEHGPLDERLMNMADHDDVCLLAHSKGQAIFIEPEARVFYEFRQPLTWLDLPYFFYRWSDHWTNLSVDRFAQKWDIAKDDPYLKVIRKWVVQHRWRVNLPQSLPEPITNKILSLLVRSVYVQSANLSSHFNSVGKPESIQVETQPAIS